VKVFVKLVAAAAIFACASAIALLGAPADWDALGKRWWSHVQYLADDRLEGRDVGSPGFAAAAQYVTEQFKIAGLQPAGVDGYAQPVVFSVAQIDEPNSSLEIVRDGKAEPIKFGEEAFFSVNKYLAAQAEAEAVFVGYGLTVPESHYDDLAGQNLKGKIAVYITGGPANIPSAVKAHYQSGEERAKRWLAPVPWASQSFPIRKLRRCRGRARPARVSIRVWS
jgi:hypothetical protein